MNKNIMDELLRVNKNLVIPGYLIKYLPELDLNTNELLLLLYFLNTKEKAVFDPNKISSNLYLDQKTILETIDSLSEKKYISIEMKKENGIIEEFISLDLFFAKINSCLVNTDKKDNSTDIYSKIEKEFGRTLSPVEYETINKWIEGNISIDLILSALKEAVLNGVGSIRYIDKILFEWNKKGYKVPSDIVNRKQSDDVIEEIYDYDWLNE